MRKSLTNVNFSKDAESLIIGYSDKKIYYTDDSENFIFDYSIVNEPVFQKIFTAKEFLLNSLSGIIKKKKL